MFFMDSKASENEEKKFTYRPVSSTLVKIKCYFEAPKEKIKTTFDIATTTHILQFLLKFNRLYT